MMKTSAARNRARASAETGPSGATDGFRDWQIMQTRLDREDEAEEMAKLWHDDPPAAQRSKTVGTSDTGRACTRKGERDRESEHGVEGGEEGGWNKSDAEESTGG